MLHATCYMLHAPLPWNSLYLVSLLYLSHMHRGPKVGLAAGGFFPLWRYGKTKNQGR